MVETTLHCYPSSGIYTPCKRLYRRTVRIPWYCTLHFNHRTMEGAIFSPFRFFFIENFTPLTYSLFHPTPSPKCWFNLLPPPINTRLIYPLSKISTQFCVLVSCFDRFNWLCNPFDVEPLWAVAGAEPNRCMPVPS